MTEQGVSVRAGWGDTRGDRISGPTMGRLAAAEAAEQREQARAERSQSLARAEWQSRSEAASIAAALDRGELFDMRQALAQGGVGRTRAEALSYFSAEQDRQDAQAAARQQAAFRRWQAEQAAAEQADTSAPVVQESAALTAARQDADRAIREREVLRRAGRQAERTAVREAHRGEVRLAGRLAREGVL